MMYLWFHILSQVRAFYDNFNRNFEKLQSEKGVYKTKTELQNEDLENEKIHYRNAPIQKRRSWKCK